MNERVSRGLLVKDEKDAVYNRSIMIKRFINKLKKTRRDADLRKFLLSSAVVLVGVLGIQLALSASYLLAFHDPQPAAVRVVVVGAAKDVDPLISSMKDAAGDSFDINRVDTLGEGEAMLRDRQVAGVYAPSVPKSTITIASAADRRLADVATRFLEQADTSYQQQARAQLAQNPATAMAAQAPLESAAVRDIVALNKNDPNGLGLFYVAFSFVFGGYLAAVAINIRRGNRRFTHRNALVRSAAFGAFALVGSVLIAWLATLGVGVFDPSAFWAVVAIGTLTTLGVGLFASALISLLGTIGTGLIILLFVVLGTPASGGPLPLALAGNGPWQWLAGVLPTGQSLEMLRSALYFDGRLFWQHAAVLLLYLLVGFVVLLLFGLRKTTISGALSAGEKDS